MALFDSVFSGENGIASVLINTLGMSGVTYKHSILGEYNPRTDTYEGSSFTTKTITTSPILRFTSSDEADFGIEQGDCKLIGKGSDFSDITNKSDMFIIFGKTYMVVNHKKVYTGENVGCIIFQLREQS